MITDKWPILQLKKSIKKTFFIEVLVPRFFEGGPFLSLFLLKYIIHNIDNIRNTITNVGSTASSTSASFITPKEKLQCFTTIGREELNKLITASKPTTCLLDPVPTKLLEELSPVAEEPLLNIINSSLSLGHVPKPFKLAVIKPIKPISNLLFMSKILKKLCLLNCAHSCKKKYLWRISVRFQAPP